MKLRIAYLVIAAVASFLAGAARAQDRYDMKVHESAAQELPGTPYAHSAQEWLEKGSLAPPKTGCLSCHAGN